MEYMKANKTDITLYFTRSLHNADIKVTENSSAESALRNLEGWTSMIREQTPKLIERVTPYTTPVFMIMHQLPQGNPTPCIKKLENQHKEFSNYTNACPIAISEEKGVYFFAKTFPRINSKEPEV